VRLINTLTYLLTYLLTNQFLLITIYGIIFKLRGGKILLEGLECNKDAQMKTYGITKLTVEMKSDSVPTKKNKIYYFLVCFDQLTSWCCL